MAILLSLADGDRHGYALMKEIEEQTDGNLRPGTGSLYAALQRLMDDGLILEPTDPPEDEDRRRRYYRITDAGRDVAREEARRMLRVLDIARRKELAPDWMPAPERVP
jgi:DNA-binding PadR family transcriptional regulator